MVSIIEHAINEKITYYDQGVTLYWYAVEREIMAFHFLKLAS